METQLINFYFEIKKSIRELLIMRVREKGGANAFPFSFLVPSLKNFVSPSEGVAEGGGWGEEFRHARAKDRGQPRRPAHQSRATQKSFLFLLEEKSGARKSGKAKKTFLWGVPVSSMAAGLASLLGVLLKKCSNFVQKTPPSFTFSEIERCCLGALRLGMVFPRKNPNIFEGERKRPVGNAEVPVRSTEKTKFSEPIFFLSLSAKG